MEPDADTLDICLPFASVGPGDFRPEWRSEVVVGLARGILEDAAFERMPILADALEEAGCTDEALLRHCRDPIPHDAQCWALGLALNRYIPPEPEPPVATAVPSLVGGMTPTVPSLQVTPREEWVATPVAPTDGDPWLRLAFAAFGGLFVLVVCFALLPALKKSFRPLPRPSLSSSLDR